MYIGIREEIIKTRVQIRTDADISEHTVKFVGVFIATGMLQKKTHTLRTLLVKHLIHEECTINFLQG